MCSIHRICRSLKPEFLSRISNDTKIIDARILAGVFPRPDEIGYGNRSQQSDNSHHDHDLHKREGIPFCTLSS
jgi:hypothetical protein